MLGIKTTILEASTSRDIDAAFAKAVELKVGALVIGADPYFDSHLDKFAAFATRFAMPTIHCIREFVTSGGLMSYGADLADAYRLFCCCRVQMTTRRSAKSSKAWTNSSMPP